MKRVFKTISIHPMKNSTCSYMYVSFTYGGNKKRKKILELKNGIVATLWKLAELKSRNAYSYSRTGTIKNITPNTSLTIGVTALISL